MNSKQNSKKINYNDSDLISGITYSSDKGLKIKVDGKDYALIAASSNNDSSITTSKFADRKGRGWNDDEHGQVLIPTEQVKGYVTFSKECYRYTE